MNFFDLQDQAHKKTWLLIALFSVAVLCIIGLTVALITASFWGFGQSTSVNHAAGIQPMQMGLNNKNCGRRDCRDCLRDYLQAPAIISRR